MEDRDELLEIWLNSIYTQKLLDRTKRERDNNLAMLVRKADESTDAPVRAAAEAYRQKNELIKLLKGGV